MICSGISTTATANRRPKRASLHLALGGHWSTRLFLAQCKARRSGPASCIGQPNGRSLGRVDPTPVKREPSKPRPARLPDPAHHPGRKRGARPYAGTGTLLHDYHRLLLPSHLGRAQAGQLSLSGLCANLSDRPTARQSLRPGPRHKIGNTQRAVSHTGPLIFRQLPFKCTMLPDDLISPT